MPLVGRETSSLPKSFVGPLFGHSQPLATHTHNTHTFIYSYSYPADASLTHRLGIFISIFISEQKKKLKPHHDKAQLGRLTLSSHFAGLKTH